MCSEAPNDHLAHKLAVKLAERYVLSLIPIVCPPPYTHHHLRGSFFAVTKKALSFYSSALSASFFKILGAQNFSESKLFLTKISSGKRIASPKHEHILKYTQNI